jgi:glycosyltransferase involved in cell wall biosynthesis
MRVVYLCDTQIPSRATSGMQIMRMCAAFARAGAEVTLVHPYRIGNRPEGYDGDLWRFYGVSPRFEIRTLPTPLTLGLVQRRRLARLIRFGPLASYALARARPGREPFVCYSRSMLGCWLMLRARRLWGARSACRGVFVELHDRPESDAARHLVDAADGVVAISEALRQRVLAETHVDPYRLSVEHDGFDAESFGPGALGRDEARRHLGLDSADGPLVVYTGRAIAGKGVDVLLEAAPALADIGAQLVIVGKVYDGEYVRLAGRCRNVSLTGFKPPADVPAYLAAADVLVLPTTPNLRYAAYTSPLKLFEYMASARPIVASDLPVFREILTDGVNALLYPPYEATAIAKAIRRLSANSGLAARLAEQASRDVQPHRWDLRAQRILAGLADAAAYQ